MKEFGLVNTITINTMVCCIGSVLSTEVKVKPVGGGGGGGGRNEKSKTSPLT